MHEDVILSHPAGRPLPQRDDEISLFKLATALLRWRRTIMALTVVGAVIGLAAALLTPRLYVSSAVFLPERSPDESSGLALAASQFGIRVPTGGGGWGPVVYV